MDIRIFTTRIFGTMLWKDREYLVWRGLVWRLWSRYLAFDGVKTSDSSAAIDVGTRERFLTDYLFDGGLEQITVSFGRRSEGQIRQIMKSWNRNLMDNGLQLGASVSRSFIESQGQGQGAGPGPTTSINGKENRTPP